MLSVTRYGAETGATPLLVAHGLFGSARNWGVLCKRLSDRAPVIAVDMRNHGESARDAEHSYPALAGDLAEVIGDGPIDVLGHSMGGKAAMVLALTRPNLLRRLIVADIAPVSYGHSQIHLVEAMQALDLGPIETRKDADEALARHVDTPAVRAFLLQSLDVREKRWALNLDALADQMELILGWPEIDGTFNAPTLFLSGGASDYVAPDGRAAAMRLFPNATFQTVEGAGHWLHAEAPRETEAAVRAFLDR